MSRKVFTDEEIEMLRSNPYTYAVTPHILSFTKEFKELFWNEYQAGIIPRQILEQHGYPSDVLGEQRIWGITQIIKKQYYSEDGLREGPPQKKKPSDDRAATATTEETVARLQHEVEYLKQEMEFLKKILSSRRTRK